MNSFSFLILFINLFFFPVIFTNWANYLVYTNLQCAGSPQGSVFQQTGFCQTFFNHSMQIECSNETAIALIWFNSLDCQGGQPTQKHLKEESCLLLTPEQTQGWTYIDCQTETPSKNKTPPNFDVPDNQDLIVVTRFPDNSTICSEEWVNLYFYKTSTCTTTDVVPTFHSNESVSLLFSCYSENNSVGIDIFQNPNCRGDTFSTGTIGDNVCTPFETPNYNLTLEYHCQYRDKTKLILGLTILSFFFTLFGIICFTICLISVIFYATWSYFSKKKKFFENELKDLTDQLNEIDKVALINFKNIKLKKQVGKGAFGEVYEGVYKKKQVAVKKQHGSKESLTETLKELQIQFTLPAHNNVVELIGFCANPVCIVLEFCQNGSLKSYIEENELSQNFVLNFLKDITRGMIHLHVHHIIHRDLATRNVLLDSKFTAKIADFGLSRQTERADNEGVTSTHIGPVKWMSPESFLEQKYSEKSDAWSFGIVILEIITQQEPFPKLPTNKFLVSYKENIIKIDEEIPEQSSQYLRELILMCTQIETTQRPNFSSILSFLESQKITSSNDFKTFSSPNNSSSPKNSKIKNSRAVDYDRNLNYYENNEEVSYQHKNVYDKTPVLIKNNNQENSFYTLEDDENDPLLK